MKNAGIYILTNRFDSMQYAGKDINLPNRIKTHLSGWGKSTKHIYNAIMKYGAENFDVEIIRYPNISHQMLCIFERSHIAELDTYHNGYNQTYGGEGTIGYKHTKDARRKQSEKAKKRIENGDHPFSDSEFQRQQALKQFENGDHPFQDSELQTKNNLKRVADGTHPAFDPAFKEAQRQRQLKRIADGTHHFQTEDVREKQREAARKSNQERLENGTHNFIGGIAGEIQRKRVQEGTHEFCDSEFQKEMGIRGNKTRARKRAKIKWCYIVALSRFWYESHDYTTKKRAEIYANPKPDTSNSTQLELF